MRGPAGPSAPWTEDDATIDYGDSPEEVMEAAVAALGSVLASRLQARLGLLAEGGLPALEAEVRRQMSTDTAAGHFGTARQLHDLLVDVYEAQQALDQEEADDDPS